MVERFPRSCRRDAGRRRPHLRRPLQTQDLVACRRRSRTISGGGFPNHRPLFDAPQGWRLSGGTPFVPTPSELHRPQAWSKARSGTGATRSASASMREHGEDPPFDHAEDGATPFRVGNLHNLLVCRIAPCEDSSRGMRVGSDHRSAVLDAAEVVPGITDPPSPTSGRSRTAPVKAGRIRLDRSSLPDRGSYVSTGVGL